MIGRRACASWPGRRGAALKRHPWLATLLSSRPPLGPHYLRYFEALLGTVAGLGLDVQTMTRVVGAVYVYVLGFVSYELGEEQSTRQTGLTEADKHRLAAPLRAGHRGERPISQLRPLLPGGYGCARR